MSRILLLMSVVILQACSPKVSVTVDSISSPQAKEKNKYLILPGNTDCSEDDLQFQEFLALTERALKFAGFEKSNSLEEADVAILLSYGISEPNVYQYTYTTPVYGQTGYSSSTTYGTLNTYGNTATYSGTTTYNPTYGITGYQTNIGTGVLFTRYMALNGVDVKECIDSSKIIPLWRTSAVSVGPNGDLRRIFPVMLGVSKGYFAKNSGEKISFEVTEDDERVLEVKGISK